MDRADFIKGLGVRARNLGPHGEQRPSVARRLKLNLQCKRASCDQCNRERYCNPEAFEIKHVNLCVAAAINEIVRRPHPAWPASLIPNSEVELGTPGPTL